MAIRTFQTHIQSDECIVTALDSCPFPAHLIMAFGGKKLLSSLTDALQRSNHEKVALCGCSTSGEICGLEIFDDTLVLNFFSFERSRVVEQTITLNDPYDSEGAGVRLAHALFAPDLRHMFVLSVGHGINGSELTNGLRNSLPKDVAVTGGLAGDGARFVETHVLSSQGVSPSSVVGIGLYGEHLSIGFGSLGGWDSFGTERVITKSSRNVLYELDGSPALPLYRSYLGDLAAELPASGLLFPLAVKLPQAIDPLVRTLLSIDEANQSLIFAGDVPEGCRARLMKANLDRLLDGASSAANVAALALDSKKAQAAILISCVGRRLVLKQRTEEELEFVREHIGTQALMTGFYSYGEIAPFMKNARCELHNQTMTITVLAEE